MGCAMRQAAANAKLRRAAVRDGDLKGVQGYYEKPHANKDSRDAGDKDTTTLGSTQ